MLTSRLSYPRYLSALCAFALMAAVSAPLHNGLLAQGVQAAPAPVRLAFGYQCADRFVVRNDGGQPVTVEYGVVGSRARSPLDLSAGEAVTITSPTPAPLQLFVNGQIVATEPNGNRACAAAPASGSGSADVMVRPLSASDSASADPTAPNATYAAPQDADGYYYAPYPYASYYGYGYAPYVGYYAPYAAPFATIRVGPGFGGFGRGIGRGRGHR